MTVGLLCSSQGCWGLSEGLLVHLGKEGTAAERSGQDWLVTSLLPSRGGPGPPPGPLQQLSGSRQDPVAGGLARERVKFNLS